MPPTAPTTRFALRGRVVTMNATRAVVNNGVIYIADGTIVQVAAAGSPPPAGFTQTPVIATAGTIYPGLIELHNHLAYNALPLWRTPSLFTNRDRWQGIKGYRRFISGPAWELGRRAETIKAVIRYVECKSLVGGVTTSQGITLRGLHLEHSFAGSVRNCEVPDHAGLPAGDPKISDVLPGGAAAFLRSLGGPHTRLLHLAEGTDASALAHFAALRTDDGRWAISPHLAGIHATALGPTELRTVAEHGGHIVWSPFSNLALYGDTTKIKVARDLGIVVALGCDWSPSGTKNLLAEMKVARLHSNIPALGVVEMVTVNPAGILGWDGLLGNLAADRLADLVVIAGTAGDPYEHLVLARESDVSLVVVGGVARYATPALAGHLLPSAATETASVAGAARVFQLPDITDPVVGTLPSLADATRAIKDVLNNLPARAGEQIDTGLSSASAATGAGPEERFVLALDLEPGSRDLADLGDLAPDAMGGPSFESLAVPLDIDPLAVEGDHAFFAQLANLPGIPTAIRAEFARLYDEVPHQPSPIGTTDDGEPLLVTTALPLSRLAAAGPGLTADEEKRIVDRAILLIEQAYVHLPLKRAMHAVDPLQRLRLMRHRLEEEPAGRGKSFHNDLTDIFTSLRDLHTHYVLPEPFRSHRAYLPFLVEEYWRRGKPHYLVSKLAREFRPRDGFAPGVELTHWNGVPIRRAIELNAERQGGSNPDARFARGLDALTIRPLARTRPPDEDWVTMTYRPSGGGVSELRMRWRTYVPFEPSPFVDSAGVSASTLGLDAQTQAVNDTRRRLYYRAGAMGTDEVATRFPTLLRARRRATSTGPIGHLRIFSFLVPDQEAFVDELARLLEELPPDGLVLDVRGNGGGDIRAAERVLQLLTPRRIDPERAQFVTSPLTLALCRANSPSRAVAGLDLSAWAPSIAQAVETGSAYSLGYPITDPATANDIGQRYYGPVVLVTDGRCYSASDIFAAGFQDHEIGQILGTAGNTGAGGANVWTDDLLRRAMAEIPGANPEPLPAGAAFRFAIRRTTRAGKRAGTPLEDLGVVPEHVHHLTERDLTDDNNDLLEAAARLLRRGRPRALSLAITNSGRGADLVVTADGIDRVDAYVDGQPLGSLKRNGPHYTLRLDRSPRPGTVVRIEGHERGELVAARREVVDAVREAGTST